MMILKTMTAGHLVQQSLYTPPRVTEADPPDLRREKEAARRSYMHWCRNRTIAMQALLFANFTDPSRPAYWCTLTFTDQTLPLSRRELGQKFSYFIKKLHATASPDIHYIRIPEHRHGVGRWHIHLVVDGCTPDQIRSAWGYGKVTHIDPVDAALILRGKKGDHTERGGLAAYICKETPDKPGQRAFTASAGRNKLIRPECVRQIVPDDYELSPPPGSELIYKRTPSENAWGRCETICYLI